MGDIARGLRGNDINDFRLDPLSSEMHRLYRKRIIQTHLINWFDLKPLVRHLICASVTKAITVYVKLENCSTLTCSTLRESLLNCGKCYTFPLQRGQQCHCR